MLNPEPYGDSLIDVINENTTERLLQECINRMGKVLIDSKNYPQSFRDERLELIFCARAVLSLKKEENDNKKN